MPAGHIVGERYRIDALLARGGMSLVYRAHPLAQPQLPVVVKQMRTAGASAHARATAFAQLQHEAQLAAGLSHPSLVEIIDVVSEGSEHFLVMPLIEGRDLDAIRREGRPPVATVIDWFGQLCAVLAWMHAQSPPIVYRDLTPRNVMCEPQGRLRLLDFGLAHRLGDNDDTRTLVKGAGTPGYAPIEQCGPGTTDVRSDIYALGATMYAVLTGTSPPPSRDRLHHERRLVPPPDLRPDTPPQLSDLIVACLAIHARQRPQHVGEVQAALDAVTAPAASPPPKTQGVTAPGTAPIPGPTRWVLRATQGADRGGRYALTCRIIDLGRGDPLLASPEHLRFLESSVSRAQAALEWDDASRRFIIVHDPRATNPTRVNGVRVMRRELEPGDIIVVGRLHLEVESEVTGARGAATGPRAHDSETATG